LVCEWWDAAALQRSPGKSTKLIRLTELSTRTK
jgi:hypothetical protein